MSAWIDNVLVRKYALVLWSTLNYTPNSPFAAESNFGTFIDTYLIPAAQAHINAACNRDFDVDYSGAIPTAIKDLCARATSNMIQYLVMNKTSPLLRVDNWAVSIPVQAVLTPELRTLLAPWMKRTVYMRGTSYKTDGIENTWD